MPEVGNASIRLSARSSLAGHPLGRTFIDVDVLREIRRVAHDCRGGAEMGGLLAGTGSMVESGAEVVVRETRFVDSSDRSVTHFAFDFERVRKVVEQAEREGLDIVGWFHTHAGGVPLMSVLDDELHRTLFGEEWQLAIVGSTVLAGPLVGIWHLQGGELTELTDYYTHVTRGIASDRHDAALRTVQSDVAFCGTWDPALLGTALELTVGRDPVSTSLAGPVAGASAAERWRTVVARAIHGASPVIGGEPEDEAARAVGVLDHVGMVSGGTTLLEGIPLAGDADFRGGVLCALDGSRSGLLVLDLHKGRLQRLRIDMNIPALVDVAFDGEAAWLVTADGEVVVIPEIAGLLTGEMFQPRLVDALPDCANPRLCAVDGVCAISWVSSSGHRDVTFCGRDPRETVETSTAQALRTGSELIAVWDGCFVVTNRHVESRWTIRNLAGIELTAWDLPEQLGGLEISHLSARAERVVVVGLVPGRELGIVLEARIGATVPSALWLEPRGLPPGRAFPVSDHGVRVVHVDQTAARSLYPGCGG